MEKGDIVFHASYLLALILAGFWLLIWAMNAVALGDAFMLWLLSCGILLVIIGAAFPSRTRSGATMQLAAGLVLAALMLMMLAVTSNVIGGLVGGAVGIILIGIVGFALLLRNMRLEA